MVSPTQPRRTLLGHMPSKWLRPRRREVVWRALLVLLYGTVLVLMTRELATLDARIVYSPPAVGEVLEAMGEHGRNEYRLVAAIDLGFLVVYGWLLVTWLRFLKVRDGLPKRLPAIVALVPSLFDAIETATILLLLRGYPEIDGTLATVAAIATPLKWGSFAVLAVVLVVGEVNRWHRRHDPR